MTAAYTLEQVAAQYLPPHWTDGERWLRRRLNRGELSGYKVGREWMMSEHDVQDFLARHHNSVAAQSDESVAPTSVVDGLSLRSRRRLRSVAS